MREGPRSNPPSLVASLAAVVPAAGWSRRMGREKVLLPFRGTTCLETVLSLLIDAGVPAASISVVVRPDLPEAGLRAERMGARAILNPHPDGEMLESIRLGVEALSIAPGTAERESAASAASAPAAFFVWPADHPAVGVETLAALAVAADPDLAWIPLFEGRRGHPALVGRSLVPDLLAIPPGAGLRELWRARRDAVREMAVVDRGVVTNVDTPEQYEAALREIDGGE